MSFAGKVEPIRIAEEMSRSFLDYSMSVIISRALPDARDGLKPSQRRILYAMHELSLYPGRKPMKCAKICGDTSGNYHPHGEAVIYPTLVHMAQPWAMRDPLVDPQGNFGSVEGDPPAAMRYCVTGDTLVVTERGLVPIAEVSAGGGEDIAARVLSMDGKVSAASKWWDCGAHPTRRVVTRRGYEVTSSLNHPLLAAVPGPPGQPTKLVWKTVANVRPGDFLVLDRDDATLWPEAPVDLRPFWPELPEASRARRHQLPAELSEDAAFLLGALLAEGTFRRGVVEFTNVPGDFADAFRAAWARVFPDCRLHEFLRPPVGHGKKPFWQMQVVAQQVIAFLRALGLSGRSATRRVPAAVLRSPRGVAAAFLRGYYEGDGAVERSGQSLLRVGLSSKGRPLLRDVQTLLLRFGIAAALGEEKARGAFRLGIVGVDALRRFEASIGFASAAKRGALADAIARHGGRALSQSDFVPFLAEPVRASALRGQREWLSKNNFDRPARLLAALPRLAEALPAEAFAAVERIARAGYLFERVERVEDAGEQPVYSLRVDSLCHSFVANGFVNHNTEARLTALGGALMSDMEQDTVNFVPNYDERLTEPTVFPAAFPNLLVNGGTGIAVGMATNLPPHNLGEIADAVAAVIENPEITAEELRTIVPGPDFPTGCVLHGTAGIQSYYATGRGSLRVRGRAEIQPDERANRERIVITEIPYGVNRALLVERIADLVNAKLLAGISAVRDESDENTRVVVELKKEAVGEVVLNNLYNSTALESSFSVQMLAIDHGRPRLLSLRDALQAYLEHRREVITRRTAFQLRKAEERAEHLEGFLVAIGNLDDFIALIRASASRDEARAGLLKRGWDQATVEAYGVRVRTPERLTDGLYRLTEAQADQILELRLYQLTGLERDKVSGEYAAVLARIDDLRDILARAVRVDSIVRDELLALKAKHARPRRTEIVPDAGDIAIEDLIPNKPCLITITHRGYIKRTDAGEWRAQRRGGKGVSGITVREGDGTAADEGDFVEHLFTASTHDYLLFFTRDGRMYLERVYEVPEGSRNSKGRSLANVLELRADEKIAAMIRIPSLGAGREDETWDPARNIVFATRSGITKKTNLSDFKNVRKGGIIAVMIEEGDELIEAKLTNGNDEIILVTHEGMSLRFHENDLRAQGRATVGVWGIRPEASDYVVAMAVVEENATLLVAGENGVGKRTAFDEYRTQSRGGKGIITMKTGDKTGAVISALAVHEEDELMLTTSKGQTTRIRVGEIREAGRNTMGVRLMNLPDDETLADIARVVRAEADEAEGVEPSAGDGAGGAA